jgi:hypothetical protein
MRTPFLEAVSQADAYAPAKIGGYASSNALQELNKAYLDLAIKNAFNMFNVVYTLSRVTTPLQLIDLQQRLIREGIGAAIRDSQRITQLTTAVVIAASRPAQKQNDEAVRKSGRR